MAGVKGRSGGARVGSGRKPSEKTVFLREFVGPLKPKRHPGRSIKYLTDADLAEARKLAYRRRYEKIRERLIELRAAQRLSEGRSKYERKVSHSLVCMLCGGHFTAATIVAKYCSEQCRNSASNKSERRKAHILKKAKECSRYSLVMRVRHRVRKAFKGVGWKKSSKTEEIIGCSFDYLVRHIERQFLPGMSWDNRSDWHIDHIVPLSSANTIEDLERLSHFTNLRPLWAKDNLKKGAKLESLI